MVDAAILRGYPDSIMCRWCNHGMNRVVLIPPFHDPKVWPFIDANNVAG